MILMSMMPQLYYNVACGLARAGLVGLSAVAHDKEIDAYLGRHQRCLLVMRLPPKHRRGQARTPRNAARESCDLLRRAQDKAGIANLPPTPRLRPTCRICPITNHPCLS